MIQVLVVDDSALMRKKISAMLSSDAEIKIIGIARDGEEAIEKARNLKPDVITLDINMPGMDGLTVLQYIVAENICPVIMLSSLTQEGALITFEAFELGAFDVVAKPGGTISLDLETIQRDLITKVKFAAKTDTLKRIKKYRESRRHTNTMTIPATSALNPVPDKAIAIGVSTGGPKVLSEIIAQLPADLNAAVFIVQHIPANFTTSFAQRLNKIAAFPIKECESGEVIKNNQGYLGKGGYHMLLKQLSPNLPPRIRLSTIPSHLFVPSVDVMMEAVLSVFQERTIGVLLTGMGDDGADSMVKITKAGGITIAESEETAVVFGMPAEAIARGGAQIVAPSYNIAREIVNAVKRLEQ